MTADLFPGPYWRKVARCDPRTRRLADRHYSRQTVGAADFTPPGRVFVLLGADDLAVWAACENFAPNSPERRFRVTIFRNEGPRQSSDIIREATAITLDRWRRKGWLTLPLQTEVDPAKTRRKRDPGRCFRKAGWKRVGERNGLVIFQAQEGE